MDRHWKMDLEKGHILYSGKDDRHEEGVGFFLSKKAYSALEEFDPISSRIAKIRLNAKWFKVSILCLHAHTEVTADQDKDEWYDQVQHIIDHIPRHDVLIILGDMNAKVGREMDAFGGAIGLHSLHEESNDNGVRIATLALQNNLIIGGTVFPHKIIHKGTWNSPDNNTVNQIDHILIKKKFRSALLDTRVYRAADCDSDHMLVVGKVKVKQKSRRTVTTRKDRIDIESLGNAGTKEAYAVDLENRFQVLNEENIDVGWEEIKTAVLEAAANTLGTVRNRRRNGWYDEECEAARERRKLRRRQWMEDRENGEKREELRRARNDATRINRRKKREALQQRLRDVEAARKCQKAISRDKRNKKRLPAKE